MPKSMAHKAEMGLAPQASGKKAVKKPAKKVAKKPVKK